MDLKGISPDKLADALRAAGYSEEEVNQATGDYSKARYQPELVALKPTHQTMSQKTIKLFGQDHALRELRADDIKRIIPKAVNVALSLLRNGSIKEDSIEAYFEKASAADFLGLITQQIKALMSGEGYPDWLVVVLEEVALITSTDERQFSAGDIISLKPYEIIALLKALWEVNQQDFLYMWGLVPEGLRSMVSTLVSPIMPMLSMLNHLSLKPPALNGGQSSGGKRSSSSPSKKLKKSVTQKLIAAP